MQSSIDLIDINNQHYFAKLCKVVHDQSTAYIMLIAMNAAAKQKLNGCSIIIQVDNIALSLPFIL